MANVAREVAVQDFERWLNSKRIKDSKREANKDFETIIVEAIMDGILIVEKDNCLTYNFPEPLLSDKGEELLSKLVFKPRIRVHELNTKLRGVKSDDGDARILAYVAAITGQANGLISKLYTEDYTICQAIVMYFL